MSVQRVRVKVGVRVTVNRSADFFFCEYVNR